jgi:hypothetical protein
MSAPLRSTLPRPPRERLRELAIRYAEADAEDDAAFERVDVALARCALALARARGWRPGRR